MKLPHNLHIVPTSRMKELKCHPITRQETRYINTFVSCQPWGLPARFRTWNVAFLITQYSMARTHHLFRETSCPHLQGKDWGSKLLHIMTVTQPKITIKMFTVKKIANSTSNTGCFILLPDRLALAQRSTWRSASVASNVVSREGLTVKNGY